MLKLYNTATKSLETFSPKDPKNVKIYTCGPTVYSSPHLGNFSAYIYWDLLLRVLKANGFSLRRVLNLTDVGHLTSDEDSGEDKLEKGAKREGKTVWEIADYYISSFKSDFKKLNLLEPAVWARATDYIEESKSLVEKLNKNGFLYETSDGLYFDTSKFPTYADFARLDLKNQKAGARVDFSSEKRNSSDFAVWKFIKPGETHAMRWDFLGRPGYPGWHLECSAIIHKELGEPIDIHAGGIDHIPVHHTNEIAQTSGAFSKKLAHFWLHCNFLKINGEKISKSLGNIITLKDLEEKGFSPFDFKLWLFQGHYRSERNFTISDLESAKVRRKNWINKLVLLYQLPESELPAPLEGFQDSVLSLLNNDLNSSSAFALIDEKSPLLSLDDWKFLDSLFALDLFVKDRTPALLLKIRQRNTAREKKNFATADKIRDELLSEGVSLLDSSDKTFWQLA
ncbi:class I tRNA ligase family protein [Candidatus Saccharibacteria bacterium]|nr:class I tRNA ligase family protein [Candidatus Saccharibacteria bacterium]